MEFPDLAKMNEMRAHAKHMQEQLEQKLIQTVVEASTGGGVATIRMNGKKEVLKLTIDPVALGSTASDLELLEDLIAAAFNEAGRRVDEAVKAQSQSILSEMTRGMNLPGLTD